MADAMAARGWKVAVYSAAGGPVTEPLQANNVKLILSPPARQLFGRLPGSGIFGLAATALHLGVLLKQRPPMVHFFLPGAYGRGAARECRAQQAARDEPAAA
jgi:hypothetical protein